MTAFSILSPLTKRSDWAERLSVFLQEILQHDTQEFAYGTFDCCLFASQAIEAMSGIDLMQKYRDRYTTDQEIQAVVRQEQASCLTALIRRELIQAGLLQKDKHLATRGDIVLLQEGALGVVALDSRHVVALHPEQGAHLLPLSSIRCVWEIA